MSLEGRTTRSAKRKLAEPSTSSDDTISSEQKRLKHSIDELVLTPPPSLQPIQLPPTPQPAYETRKSCREKSSHSQAYHPFETDDLMLTPPPSQPPATPQPTYETRKTRREKISHLPMYHQYQGPGSSGTFELSDPSLTGFQQEDMNDDFGLFLNDNDPYLGEANADNDSQGGHESINTPNNSPPRLNISDVPTPMMRPDTPTPRPSTPGGGLNYIDGDNGLDTTFETSSFVGVNYGPPPTPACPPLRVGPLSTSSLFAHMPNIPTASTSASAALPLNILGSDEEEITDDCNDNSNQADNTEFRKCSVRTNGYSLSTSNHSPDITNHCEEEHGISQSVMAKHLRRLRIRAPEPKAKAKQSQSQKKRLYNTRQARKEQSDSTGNKEYPQDHSSSPRKRNAARERIFKEPELRPKIKLIFVQSPQPEESDDDGGTNSTPPENNSKTPSESTNDNANASKIIYSTSNKPLPDLHPLTSGCVLASSSPHSLSSPSPLSSLSTTSPHSLPSASPSNSPAYLPSSSPHPFPVSFPKPIPRFLIGDKLKGASKNQENVRRMLPNPVEAATTNKSSALSSPRSGTTFGRITDHINRSESDMRDGNIISLRLQNFMSYKKFYMEWNPNVNFIQGVNGSGKSVIMNACLIVFGGKAAQTQRTSKLKGLIKRGCSEAEIEIRLTNYNGTLKKAVYGDEITILRKIRDNASAFYQVGTPQGKKRPLKQSELAYITHYLQIDPSNPVQFLRQDEASKNSDPGKQRFKEFKDATQLSLKEQMLKEAQQDLDVVKSLITQKEEDWKVYAWQTRKAKEEYEQILKLEKSKNLLQDLCNELTWAKVKDKEHELLDMKSKKMETFEAIEKIKEEKRKLEDQIANINLNNEKNQVLLKKTKIIMNELTEEKEQKMAGLREKRRSQNQVRLELKAMDEQIKRYKKDIATAQAQMQTVTVNYEEQNKKYRKIIESCEAAYQEKEEALKVLRENRDKIMSELSDFKARQIAGHNNLKKLEAKLKQSKQESDKSSNFGPQVAELKRKINEYKGWTITPVGPLGANVTVKDPKYALLIERILYSSMFTFVVQTKEDFAKLRDIKAQVIKTKGVGPKDPTILYVPGIKLYEYSARVDALAEKMRGFSTVLSKLDVKDPIVKIGLIETAHCERIALFEDIKAANASLKDERRLPHELMNAYTLDWYKVNIRPFYQYHPLRSKQKAEFLSMSKMNENIEYQIKKEIAEEKAVLETCRVTLDGHRDGREIRPGLVALLSEEDRKIHEMNKELKSLRDRMKLARSSIKENPASQDKDYESEMKMVSDMQAELERETSAKEELFMTLKGLESEIGEINASKAEIEAKMEDLQKQINSIESENQSVHRNVAKFQKQIDGFKTQVGRYDQEFEKLKRHEMKTIDAMNALIKEANVWGDRPKVLNRTPEAVQRELDDLEVFLEQNKDKLSSKKRVHSDYLNSKALVDQITREINCIKHCVKKLEPYIKVSEDVYEKMQKNLGNMLQQSFLGIVEAHSTTGRLLVDWTSDSIVYYTAPDKNAEARARKNYAKKDGETVIADKVGIINYFNGLSGGERSRCLVFFVMSMWRITDLPFHMLDEFEACLDVQARGGLHTTLMTHARTHSNAQFFIMTPLPLPPIPKSDPLFTHHEFMKRAVVHYLEPSRRRNQNAIDNDNSSSSGFGDEEPDQQNNRTSTSLRRRI